MPIKVKGLILLMVISVFFMGCSNLSKKTLESDIFLVGGRYRLYNGVDSIPFDNIIAQERVLIIYLTDLGCSPCAEKELAILNSLPNDASIIIIGKFSSNRDYRIFAAKSKFPTFRIKSRNKLFSKERIRHNYSLMVENKSIKDVIDVSETPLESTRFYREILGSS